MRATRYPLYVPTKGRWQRERCLTIRTLLKDDVPFRAVVEPQEAEHYEPLVGADRMLVLPHRDKGLFTTRCWIMEHSIEEGHGRHWQLDDNMRDFRRMWRGRRIPAHPALALGACEIMSDRYENVGLSGLAYQMFAPPHTSPPYRLNCHVYSCTLVNNQIPHRWRLPLNDDTDMCLQVLHDGWAIIQVNAFMCDKMPTMKIKGGNYNDASGPVSYDQQDAREEMSQALIRAWPKIVTRERRYGRQAHVIDWKQFAGVELRRRPDIDFRSLPSVDELGCKLVAVRPVESPYLLRLLEEFPAEARKVGTRMPKPTTPEPNHTQLTLGEEVLPERDYSGGREAPEDVKMADGANREASVTRSRSTTSSEREALQYPGSVHAAGIGSAVKAGQDSRSEGSAGSIPASAPRAERPEMADREELITPNGDSVTKEPQQTDFLLDGIPSSGATLPSSFVVVGDEMYPVVLADAAQAGHLSLAECQQRYALHQLVVESLK